MTDIQKTIGGVVWRKRKIGSLFLNILTSYSEINDNPYITIPVHSPHDTFTYRLKINLIAFYFVGILARIALATLYTIAFTH